MPVRVSPPPRAAPARSVVRRQGHARPAREAASLRGAGPRAIEMTTPASPTRSRATRRPTAVALDSPRRAADAAPPRASGRDPRAARPRSWATGARPPARSSGRGHRALVLAKAPRSPSASAAGRRRGGEAEQPHAASGSAEVATVAEDAARDLEADLALRDAVLSSTATPAVAPIRLRRGGGVRGAQGRAMAPAWVAGGRGDRPGDRARKDRGPPSPGPRPSPTSGAPAAFGLTGLAIEVTPSIARKG
jgi:hypothetical protein